MSRMSWDLPTASTFESKFVCDDVVPYSRTRDFSNSQLSPEVWPTLVEHANWIFPGDALRSFRSTEPGPGTITSSRDESSRPSRASLIVPGQSVGLLSLGDTRDLALKIFPPKENIDSEYSYTFCGPRSEIFWLDINLKNQKAAGYVSIFLRDGRIFQIESATLRFRTREGITEDTHPEKVKQHYKELKAYFLWRSGGEEVGGRDLIYWVSQE